MLSSLLRLVLVAGSLAPVTASAGAPRYDVGSPVLKDLWVSESGNDEDDGVTRATAVRTLSGAWRRIPEGTLAGTGWRIRIAPGRYLGAYLESKKGTFAFPIVIEPSDGPGTVVFGPGEGRNGNITLFDVAYVYLQDFRIAVPGGDGFQCERCDHVLLRRMRVSGQRSVGQDETLKLNQSRFLYLEDSDLSGAGDNNIDLVAVEGGHVLGNRIHDANDWCLYLKGGSAYLRVEENEVFDCGTGGFTAGQGSGFQFMRPPFLHYETYDSRFVNNVIHDTEGAGFGVNGGYDILMAHNTAYRVGRRSHLIEVVYGSRSCDGPEGAAGREVCGSYLSMGGWGTTRVDDGTNFVRIPDRNVYLYDNLVYNPAGFTGAQLLTVSGPWSGPSQDGSNVAVPARADDNLRIRGNVVYNGVPDTPLGVEEESGGCQPSNPTCNATQLRADNAFGTEPRLVAPASGDFRPVVAGAGIPIPPFPGGDRPVSPPTPAGGLTNTVTTDAAGLARGATPVPGAFQPSGRTFTSTLLVPIVLSSAGANGSFFTTELTLTNRGATTATVRYDYTGALDASRGSGTDTLTPGQQKVVPDAIAYLKERGVPLPGSGDRGGVLRVTFSGLATAGDGAVTARTTTAVAQGRAGLAYAGLPPSRLLKYAAHLCGLRQNEKDRSNVALVHAGDPVEGPITLRLTVYDGDRRTGRTLPDETLQAGGFRQLSGVLGEAGATNGFVRVERVAGSALFYAYGVINDQVTSDGSYVEPVPAHALTGRTDVTIPAVVEAGSFSSEVVLTNVSGLARRLRLRYVADAIQTPDHGAEITLDLPPGAQTVIPGFVKSLRDRGAPGVGSGTFAGPLFVSVGEGGDDLDGIVAGVRTSAVGASGGSFGLFYGGVARGAGAIGTAWVYGLRQDAGNRTNLALVNTGERDATEASVYRVEVFDGDTGRPAGTAEGESTTVAGRGFRQIGTVLAALAPGTRNGYARITRLTGVNPWVAYGVINDGAAAGEGSGDGAYVAATVDGGE